MSKWYGKYRAKVVDIVDPEKRGRIRVECPKVLGASKSSWCEPCVPVAYESGGDFCLPKLNDAVWVEFEDGDANKPIYVGGWWSKEKTPVTDYTTSGKVRIIEYGGAKISITDTGVVTITATKINFVKKV